MFTRNWYKAFGWIMAMNNQYRTFTNVQGANTNCSTYNSDWVKLNYNTDSYATPSMWRVRTALGQNAGIYFGTGTTAATIDDYALSGEIISTISYSSDVQVTLNDDIAALIGTYTVTNTGTETITIGEVALMAGLGGSGVNYQALLERTVLESPITIEPGGVGQVTYTIRMNYPTA